MNTNHTSPSTHHRAQKYWEPFSGMRVTNSEINNDENNPSVNLLGPHGNPRRNERGDLIIGIINQ